MTMAQIQTVGVDRRGHCRGGVGDRGWAEAGSGGSMPDDCTHSASSH